MQYTIIQKIGVIKLFQWFERSLYCSARLYLLDQIYSKSNNIMKYYNLK